MINVQLPSHDATTVTFAVGAGTGGQPHERGQLTLDRAGREVR
jgi:hypothetical protein